jgi:hypothetical protein
VRGIVAGRVTDSSYSALPVARRRSLSTMSHLAETRPHFVSYQFDALPADPARRIQSTGWPVIAWTIRNATEAARARRYGDQITFEGFRPE